MSTNGNSKKSRISYYVLLPAYNVEKHLRELIGEIKKHTDNILVIDDGSRDRTIDIIKEMQIEYIVHPKNKGKGAALSDGYEYLLKKPIDYVLTMDSDGQHSPADIPSFLRTAQATRADIIIGNRMGNTKEMPLIRYLTNRFMSWIISKMCGQHIPDSQCGYRFISKKVLQSIVVKRQNYDAESEILVKASRTGFRIANAPVRTIYGLEKSTINPIRDTIRFFSLIYRLSRNKPVTEKTSNKKKRPIL